MQVPLTCFPGSALPLNMINWHAICGHLCTQTRSDLKFSSVSAVSGGNSNQTYLLSVADTTLNNGTRKYFVKLNADQYLQAFISERVSLESIWQTHSVCVPQVIVQGLVGEYAYLVLEYLPLSGSGNSHLLGTQLAAMHRTQATHHGWQHDNTLGLTTQLNTWTNDWSNFWREQRLGYQLDLARQNGFCGKLQSLGHRVLDALPDLLAGHQPPPSLLHGDLWSGNHGYQNDGSPVIFDPASYYGDRETDIAMTELFGGFHHDFYTAYRSAYPLDAGYESRRSLYNLYHILNHCNMVSSSYVMQAEAMMKLILAGQTGYSGNS